MAISFKGAYFPQDIILMGVRWSVAYPLSYRHVEGLAEERGVPSDHATLQRWGAIAGDAGKGAAIGTPKSVTLPQFIKLNFTEKTLSTTESAQRQQSTAIKNIEQCDGRMIL